MREFLIKILSTTTGSIEITCFSIWHILYLLIIIGGTIGAMFAIKNRTDKTKDKVLRILAYSVIITYIAEFFIMPLARTGGGYRYR